MSGATTREASQAKLPSEVRVTLLADLTGSLGYAGQYVAKGVRLAASEANASRLLGKTKIRLDILNTGSDPTTAVSLMQKAISSGSSLVIGPVLASEALAIAPIAQRSGMPYVSVVTQAPVITFGDYIYNTTTIPEPIWGLEADYVKSLKVKDVVLVCATNIPVYETQCNKTFPSHFDKAGIKVQIEAVTSTATNFDALVTKLLNRNPAPDLIGLRVVGAQFPALITALRSGGYKGRLMLANAAQGQLAPAKALADNTFWGLDYTPFLPYPSTKKFSDAYRKRYKEEPVPYAAQGYDGMRFAVLALSRSKSAARKDVKEGMRKQAKYGMAGSVGRLRFRDALQRRGITVPGAIVMWRDGKERLVKLGK